MMVNFQFLFFSLIFVAGVGPHHEGPGADDGSFDGNPVIFLAKKLLQTHGEGTGEKRRRRERVREWDSLIPCINLHES